MIFPQILDIFKSVYRSDANEDLASKLLMTAWSYLLVVFIRLHPFISHGIIPTTMDPTICVAIKAPA